MAKAPKKGPYIPGVTPTGATGLPAPTGGLLGPGSGDAPYLPKPIYIPGISPTGATGLPSLPTAGVGAFMPQPALPGGWGGAPAPWPPSSTFNPTEWNQSPLMGQYASQFAPLAGLYGTAQSNALMNQLHVPMPTYGNINWGSPITTTGTGGGGDGVGGGITPGVDAPPGTLPTTGTGGQIVSPVDVIWGGRPPGAFPGNIGAGGATGDGSFWDGVGDWLVDHAADIGTVVGTIGAGPLGGIVGGMVGNLIGGDSGLGYMPATPGGVALNPQPVEPAGTDEIGYMPATPGGVAVNPQPVAPVSPLTEQPTSAFAQWMLTAPAGSTVDDFYAAQGGLGPSHLPGVGGYVPMTSWEDEKAAMLEKWQNRYLGQNR